MTAAKMTIPLTAPWLKGDTPINTIPSCNVRMKSPPNNVPRIMPLPPKRLVPPLGYKIWSGKTQIYTHHDVSEQLGMADGTSTLFAFHSTHLPLLGATD